MTEKEPVQKTLSLADAADNVMHFKFVPDANSGGKKASREMKFKESVTEEPPEDAEKVILVCFPK